MNTSWGLEMVEDRIQNKKIVLFHHARRYLQGTDADFDIDERILEDFKDLTDEADEDLGKRIIDGKELVGFRVMKDQNRYENKIIYE